MSRATASAGGATGMRAPARKAKAPPLVEPISDQDLRARSLRTCDRATANFLRTPTPAESREKLVRYLIKSFGRTAVRTMIQHWITQDITIKASGEALGVAKTTVSGWRRKLGEEVEVWELYPEIKAILAEWPPAAPGARRRSPAAGP